MDNRLNVQNSGENLQTLETKSEIKASKPKRDIESYITEFDHLYNKKFLPHYKSKFHLKSKPYTEVINGLSAIIDRIEDMETKNQVLAVYHLQQENKRATTEIEERATSTSLAVIPFLFGLDKLFELFDGVLFEIIHGLFLACLLMALFLIMLPVYKKCFFIDHRSEFNTLVIRMLEDSINHNH